MAKAKFAEEERREALEDRARLLARQKHQEILNKQLQEKQIYTENTRLEELKQIEAQQQKENYRLRVIEEAKRRLLQEHSDAVQGYLPRSKILQSTSTSGESGTVTRY